MIRGYHEYKSIWENPSEDDELICEREVGNPRDTHAVAIKKSIAGECCTVGHIPRKISSICSIFIRRGGAIYCIASGHRRYSSDLPQGGLEVPCALTFVTKDNKDGQKTKKLIESALGIETLSITIGNNNHSKWNHDSTGAAGLVTATVPQAVFKGKENIALQPVSQCLVDLIMASDDEELASDNEEAQPPRKKQRFDEEGIIMGKQLTDFAINYAQELLKAQYPKLNGFKSTLSLEKKVTITENVIKNNIQIVHCLERHHWITVTTIHCNPGEARVFDSVFSFCDKQTTKLIYNLFQHTSNSDRLVITMGRCQKQSGGNDCGLFSIASATALAFGLNPSKMKFRQDMMRAHLVDCFKNQFMTPFPCM